jgi:hypothetical protein
MIAIEWQVDHRQIVKWRFPIEIRFAKWVNCNAQNQRLRLFRFLIQLRKIVFGFDLRVGNQLQQQVS